MLREPLDPEAAVAIHHTLLYIVFTKGSADLGRGVSLIVRDEGPLISHLTRVFGVHRLPEIQRKVYLFLEEHADELKYHHSREALLRNFELEYESRLVAGALNLAKRRLGVWRMEEAYRVVGLYAGLREALGLVDEVKYGRGVVGMAGTHSLLVEPGDERESTLLQALASVGLAVHLPAGAEDAGYLVKRLRSRDHFILPFTTLQAAVIEGLRKLAEEAVIGSHKAVQSVLVELGSLLGYEARAEKRLEELGYRLDVAWFRAGRLSKAFEVQFTMTRKGLLEALQRLRLAARLGAKAYLVVPSDRRAVDAARALIEGETGPATSIYVITAGSVVRLYDALREDRSLLTLLR